MMIKIILELFRFWWAIPPNMHKRFHKGNLTVVRSSGIQWEFTNFHRNWIMTPNGIDSSVLMSHSPPLYVASSQKSCNKKCNQMCYWVVGLAINTCIFVQNSFSCQESKFPQQLPSWERSIMLKHLNVSRVQNMLKICLATFFSDVALPSCLPAKHSHQKSSLSTHLLPFCLLYSLVFLRRISSLHSVACTLFSTWMASSNLFTLQRLQIDTAVSVKLLPLPFFTILHIPDTISKQLSCQSELHSAGSLISHSKHSHTITQFHHIYLEFSQTQGLKILDFIYLYNIYFVYTCSVNY